MNGSNESAKDPPLARERRRLVLVGCFVGIVQAIGLLALGFYYWTEVRPRWWKESLAAQIRAAEPELLAYVRDVRTGKLRAGTGPYDSRRYPIPPLRAAGPVIEHVTMDRGGNVIFQTEHSLNWDVGFEHRNGNAEVRGTGIGDVNVGHLFGDWWWFDDYGP